jgi:Ran GTPase-activating protein (RanGAP) involved in mRNA processing and transport
MADVYLDLCAQQSLEPLERVTAALTECAQSGQLALRGSNAVARVADEACEALGAALPASRAEVVDLSNNSIGCSGAAALCADGRCASLLVLNLGENAISWSGAKALAANLQGGALEELVLDANPLGDAGGAAIAALVESLPRLAHLRLCRCDLGVDGLIALASALGRSATLRLLDLSEPLLFSRNEETTSHLARALTANASLVRLALRKHPHLTDTSVEMLTDALLDNAVLQELDLSANALGPPSGALLAAALTAGSGLSVLQLAGCRLCSAGIAPLAAALASGATALRHLDVRNNSCGEEGVVALVEALASPACPLETLLLWGNPGLAGAGAEALGALLASGHLRCALDVAVTVVDGQAQVCELKV